MVLFRRSSWGVGFLVWVASGLAGCQRHQPPTPQAPAPEAPFQSPSIKKAPEAPSVPDGFVLRPTFDTTLGNFSAGTAFSVKLPGHSRPIVLTALHLLGPGGGLPRDVPAPEVLQAVKRLTLKDC